MIRDLKSISFNGIIYLITAVLSKGLNILLLPIYTKYLSVEEYGSVSLLLLFQSIMLSILGLGQVVTVKKSYFEYKKENKEYKDFFTTVVFFTFLIDIVIVLGFCLLGDKIFFLFFDDISFSGLGIYVLISALLLIPYQLFLKLCQTRNQSIRYSVLEIFYMIFNNTLSLVLIIYLSMGVLGRSLGIFFSTLIIFLVSLFFLKKEINFRFDPKIYKTTLIIGFPIIFHSLAGFILNLSDRIFLNKVYGLEVVGIYSLGYQIGQLIDIISLSFIEAWSTYFMRYANSEGDKRNILSKLSYYFWSIMTIISLGVSLFSKEIIIILFDETYIGASAIVPLVVVGYLIKNIYYLSNQQLILKGKTNFLLVATGISSAANLLLNYLTIYVLDTGMYGAALSTIISFVIMSAISYVYGQKAYFIPYPKQKMLLIFLLFILGVSLTYVPYFQHIWVKIFIFMFFAGTISITLLIDQVGSIKEFIMKQKLSMKR